MSVPHTETTFTFKRHSPSLGSIISEFENSNFLKSISLATFIKIKLIFRLQYLNVYKQSNDKKRD